MPSAGNPDAGTLCESPRATAPVCFPGPLASPYLTVSLFRSVGISSTAFEPPVGHVRGNPITDLPSRVVTSHVPRLRAALTARHCSATHLPCLVGAGR